MSEFGWFVCLAVWVGPAPTYRVTGPERDLICAHMVAVQRTGLAASGSAPSHYKTAGCGRAVGSNLVSAWSDDPDALKAACTAWDAYYAQPEAAMLTQYLATGHKETNL